VLHKFDENIYPGGFNKTNILTIDELPEAIKQRLLEASTIENRELVRSILNFKWILQAKSTHNSIG